MTGDILGSLFDLQDERLRQLGNPLSELDRTVDWASFRSWLDPVHEKERKSRAGARPRDGVMRFKGGVIQNGYGLRDDPLEYQVEDRRGWRPFVGLGAAPRAPDAKTFWAFRNRLAELDGVASLFEPFSTQLKGAGDVARQGQMIDASLVCAPVQRHPREDNARIKAGQVPADSNDPKRRQQESDARWTKKHGKSGLGYQNPIPADNTHQLMRDDRVTAASVHDAQVFEQLLDRDNTSQDVWADRAYRSEAREASLKRQGYRSRIQRQGTRNRPAGQRERQGNRTRSRVRSRVEPVFGSQTDWRNQAIPGIGLTRARLDIGLMNLTCNMRRLCFLERVSAS